MDSQEIKKFKELIDSFNNGYYEKENDKIQQEIDNIIMGRPRLEGIRYKVRSEIVPENEREKEIKKLRNQIKDNNAKSKELGYALSLLRNSADTLEKLAEQDVLLPYFKKFLVHRESIEIGKTDIYKENKAKYSKLYFKSHKKIQQVRQKISKEMYKIIKKNLNEFAYETSNGYRSIERAFEDNKVNLHTSNKASVAPGDKIFLDVGHNYRSFDDISRLGVDVKRLKYAIEQIKGELNPHSLTWHGKESFAKLKNIEVAQKINIETKGGYSRLEKLKEKYIEIIELSRETWYLDEILAAFRNTNIIETEMYKGLQEIVKEQERELYKLTSELDKEYERTGLQNKIDLIEQLEELYRNAEELKLKIANFEKMGDYRQVDFIEQDYYRLRHEMIKILKDNPDLNKLKYNIDIKKILEEEIKMFEPEIKKGLNKSEQNNLEENKDYRISSEIPSYIKTPEEEIFVERTVPQTPVTDEPVVEEISNIEEIPAHIQTKEEEMFVEKTYMEETDKLENFELDSDLQIQRIMHYQNYMREKVLNSDLGKLSFSVYLESVAPHLTKLINIEKEREKLARTIYKDYIRYYSSLENKKYAIEFYEFAQNNYGISNADVPIEHEEEYKGMMKR